MEVTLKVLNEEQKEILEKLSFVFTQTKDENGKLPTFENIAYLLANRNVLDNSKTVHFTNALLRMFIKHPTKFLLSADKAKSYFTASLKMITQLFNNN
jgi:hypothetical protein